MVLLRGVADSGAVIDSNGEGKGWETETAGGSNPGQLGGVLLLLLPSAPVWPGLAAAAAATCGSGNSGWLHVGSSTGWTAEMAAGAA